jgi:hypothetical protein
VKLQTLQQLVVYPMNFPREMMLRRRVGGLLQTLPLHEVTSSQFPEDTSPEDKTNRKERRDHAKTQSDLT